MIRPSKQNWWSARITPGFGTNLILACEQMDTGRQTQVDYGMQFQENLFKSTALIYRNQLKI